MIYHRLGRIINRLRRVSCARALHGARIAHSMKHEFGDVFICVILPCLSMPSASINPLSMPLRMRNRLDICVRPISPINKFDILPWFTEPTRHTIHECHKIVAVRATHECPWSFSRAELSHTCFALDLRSEIVRCVTAPDPRPVALVACRRETVTRTKGTARHTATLARRVEFARCSRPVSKWVPVASVAVRYNVEACMAIKVDERIWLVEIAYCNAYSNANTAQHAPTGTHARTHVRTEMVRVRSVIVGV